MTKERREEVVIVALVLSVAAHIGLMFFVRTQVMTQSVPVAKRAARAVPMRVTKDVPTPDPVKIDELLDLKALKDAPAAVADKVAPQALPPSAAVLDVEVPEATMPAPPMPAVEAATAFDSRPVGLDAAASTTVIPMTKIETPKRPSEAEAVPVFATKTVPAAAAVGTVPSVPAIGKDPTSVFLPTTITSKLAEGEQQEKKVVFTPADEIYTKVDEKVVAEEKAAVKELVDADVASDLHKSVNVVMTSASAGGWRYFKVMMSPRSDLRVVPKDIVLLIDGSGSIGNDRLSSCRRAARRILRTCTNTGDRFNLVVFRNAFSYAFRNWRDCDAESFAAGDKWLSNQTAHGRTDVFSTIRSVLTLPRDPKRPLIALVVTDGDANTGVSNTAEILSKFTALNDGLVSVYMYGVKSSANRELIDVLTHGNRGESFIFEGWRWSAGEGMDGLSDRFRDPVLSDLRVIFGANTPAEAYPRLLRNLYRGDTLSFVGRVPASVQEIAFSIKGLNGSEAFEGFFKLPLDTAPTDASLVSEWESERLIDGKLTSSARP